MGPVQVRPQLRTAQRRPRLVPVLARQHRQGRRHRGLRLRPRLQLPGGVEQRERRADLLPGLLLAAPALVGGVSLPPTQGYRRAATVALARPPAPTPLRLLVVRFPGPVHGAVGLPGADPQAALAFAQPMEVVVL